MALHSKILHFSVTSKSKPLIWFMREERRYGGEKEEAYYSKGKIEAEADGVTSLERREGFYVSPSMRQGLRIEGEEERRGKRGRSVREVAKRTERGSCGGRGGEVDRGGGVRDEGNVGSKGMESHSI